ncbi:TOBE domain-containing protein [Calothrix sp. NIES-3974]|uniref:TOBE domain-containing protein n=1 Tax=Calothrix sp. NIES-3974 TaxID=2005462 RepID=UPI000BBCB203|nr:molybdopterin-binding protein [Calothrix sp. NIES-3974]
MKLSARNTIKGKVKKIMPGVVSTEVVLELTPGIELTAVITKDSAQSLGLTVGKEAYAVIKSTDVMVGVD